MGKIAMISRAGRKEVEVDDIERAIEEARQRNESEIEITQADGVKECLDAIDKLLGMRDKGVQIHISEGKIKIIFLQGE